LVLNLVNKHQLIFLMPPIGIVPGDPILKPFPDAWRAKQHSGVFTAQLSRRSS